MAIVISGTPALARHQRTPAQLLETIRGLDGGVTRADLGRLTGLSRSAVAHAVAALLADGLITEREPGGGHAGQRGRPAALLTPSRPPGHVVGIDFGHAHVGAAVADTAGAVLAEGRLGADVDHRGRGARRVGTADARPARPGRGAPRPGARHRRWHTGAAGPAHQGITAPWHPGRVGRPGRRARTGDRFGRPVEVANDADLGALGEARFGAARGRRDFMYVKVSHGIGVGLVLGGRIYRGAAGLAGEIGHTSLPDATEWCRCGNRGCLETVVSLAPLYRRLARIGVPPAAGGAGWPVTRLQDNTLAARVLTEAGRILGRILADLCNCLNPEAVILGGEIGTAGPPLVAGVRESIDRYAQPAAAEAVQVLPAGLGARSELMGAVALAAGKAAGLR
jgi:predicted NBD/HSP70 family sugar kinase